MKSSEIAVPRRVYHWINLVSMAVLAVSGWYVHKPFAPDLMGLMRYAHLTAAYIFSINLVLRVYYAFGKNGDWRKYLKPQINRKMLRLTFRHYLLYEHLPEGDHYRILQNASYLVIVILLFVQIITGVLLIEAEGSLPTQVITLLGGINAVRQGHLFLTWVFAAFTVIHVYMAFTEDFPKVKLIFLGMADEKYSGQ